MTRWLLLATLMLAGCSTSGPAVPDLCAGWQPIRPGALDVMSMSAGLVAQILAHDMHGQLLCGWAP